jgi:23S rRNA pseudouridine1911/1915/1917 synthase
MVVRTFVVSRAEAGRPIVAVLPSRFRISEAQARQLLRAGRVKLDGAPCLDFARRLRSGQRVQLHATGKHTHAGIKPSDRSKRRSDASELPNPTIARLQKQILIRHADDHIVVVDKPPGLTTVRHAEEVAALGERAKRFLPPTLVDLLPEIVAKKYSGRPVGRIRAVHRLDKETSGLVVLARTPAAERHLGRQFRAHTIDRCYVALVRGKAKLERIESYLVRDRGDGRRGSSTTPGEGQRAVTHVKVLEDLGDFSLVECRLETGRTHQVRIHLGERGTPLCGERIYDRPLHGAPLPDASGAERPMLHAASLGFVHPGTGQSMAWRSPLPLDMKESLQKLRRPRRRKL